VYKVRVGWTAQVRGFKGSKLVQKSLAEPTVMAMSSGAFSLQALDMEGSPEWSLE
jgi:hypothetical protein